MELKEVRDKVEEMVGSTSLNEMVREQDIGITFFRSTVANLGSPAITKWLCSQEWEDTMVPMRLPKGISEQLKEMDQVRAEHLEKSHCDDCEKKAGCLIPNRNPSEILLTTLLKYAFTTLLAKQAALRNEPKL